MKVGILAVQGAFVEHAHCLDQLSVSYTFLRNKNDIAEDMDRLILPGGESTVQNKLLHDLQMYELLKERIENGMPVLATCAGLILLSENVRNKKSSEKICFGTLPVATCRNAYGRQLGSFSAQGDIGHIADYPMRFIRAPYIENVLGADVEILNITDGKITAVKYGKQIGMAFHPELTEDLRIHERFLSL